MEPLEGVQSILWRRLDRPGHEFASIFPRDSGWQLSGTAVFAHEHRACRLDYQIECDSEWRTSYCRVTGWVSGRAIEINILVDASGCWQLNGTECRSVAGCIDVDLNFSPSTNVLPIRRLGLDPGADAEVHAAWLRFPSFALDRLDQHYRRIDAQRYRYESGGGAFEAELEVNSAGLVTRYPNFCVAEASR